MKRVLTWLTVGVVGVLGWLVFKTFTAPKQKGIKRRASVPVAVEITPIRKGTIRDQRLFIGTLISPDMYLVSPKVAGRVRKIAVNIGDQVKEGQILAYLEDEEYRLQVQQAQAEVLVAQARVEEQTSALHLAQKEFQRVKQLQQKKLVSQAELDSTEAKYRVESAKRKVVLAQVRQQQALLRAAQVRLSYTRLRASSVTPRVALNTPSEATKPEPTEPSQPEKASNTQEKTKSSKKKKATKNKKKSTKSAKSKKSNAKPSGTQGTNPTQATSPKASTKAQGTNATAKNGKANAKTNAKAKTNNGAGKANQQAAERVWMVGERFVNEGALVQVNNPVVSVLDLRTLLAVIHVTEVEYPRLYVGQRAEIRSHIFRGKTFVGEVRRIAPILKDNSRHARVEIAVPNASLLLKPGMFMRVHIEFARQDQAILAPRVALVTRKDKQGVFLADVKKKTVKFVPVKIGIVSGAWVEVQEPNNLQGSVVTLGYHLLAEDSRIVLPGEKPQTSGKKSGSGKGRKNRKKE